MKTINDAAKEHAKEVNNEYYDEFSPNSNFTVGEICETDFKCGVAFAQQWIPVEEELPQMEDKFNMLSEVVLVKAKDLANEITAYYDYDYKLWISYPGNLYVKTTYWRPIELK